MSIFGAVFGSDLKYKYSPDLKAVPEREIKRLVSHHQILTLDAGEEDLVEQAILQARGSDGHISMRQVYETLQHLYNQKKISITDKQKLLDIFEAYFKTV